MKTLILLTILSAVFELNGNILRRKEKTLYAFYRSLERDTIEDVHEGTRRVFGGKAAELTSFPGAAALLDRYWTTRCSGAVIAEFWALTAAHCVTSKVAYVKYNSRRPTASDGKQSPVMYLYRHPNYKVVQEDEGRGMDVTLLHHDLGLLRVRDAMILKYPIPPLESMRKYNPANIDKAQVMVMGFGKTESTRGNVDELFGVKLNLVTCERGAWYHCVCGISGAGSPRGVCTGDSGGPVVYKGIQVAVTSMGPLECASIRSKPQEGATSVFTSLYNYVDLINATIIDTENVLKKRTHFKTISISGTTILKHHIYMLVMLIFTY